MLKKCAKCGVEKSEDAFSQKSNIKSACIDCNRLVVADLNKKYREKNKAALNEKKKEYVKNNKELVKQRQQDWHKKNSALNKKKRQEKYKDNKESVLQDRKEYYENNKELIKARDKRYAKTAAGIKVRKSAITKYYDTKPEKKEEYGVRHFITFVIKPKILFRDEYTCQLCGDKDGNFHCHHIIPVSIAPDKIEDPTNLITLCQSCHSKAHNGDWQKINLTIQGLLQENKNLQKEILWEK